MPQKVTLTSKGTKKGNRSFKITAAVERKRLEGRDKVFLFYYSKSDENQ